VQVAIPPTASEFRGGIIGVTLRPVSGADNVRLITDEHLVHSPVPSRVYYIQLRGGTQTLGKVGKVIKHKGSPSVCVI